MANHRITTKVREIPTSNLIQLDSKFMGTRFLSSPQSGPMAKPSPLETATYKVGLILIEFLPLALHSEALVP